jgi:hypothetical protein
LRDPKFTSSLCHTGSLEHLACTKALSSIDNILSDKLTTAFTPHTVVRQITLDHLQHCMPPRARMHERHGTNLLGMSSHCAPRSKLRRRCDHCADIARVEKSRLRL